MFDISAGPQADWARRTDRQELSGCGSEGDAAAKGGQRGRLMGEWNGFVTSSVVRGRRLCAAAAAATTAATG